MITTHLHETKTNMNFHEQSVFHIYNQGNNRQQVFYEEDHYHDFLFRMRRFLLPHLDILAYCLMPNHFHFLVYVKQLEAEFPKYLETPKGKEIVGYSTRSLNLSIGILLRSYTAYLNKQRKTNGSVFRQKTKAKEDWIGDFITVNDKEFFGGKNYGLGCFHYIHKNPKALSSVKDLKDYPYSSYLDYVGVRNGTLCNQALARQLWDIGY